MRIFATIALFGLLFLKCSTREDKILPEVRTLTESVYSSATIQPDSLYEIYASVSGILDDIFVEEGDIVSKGQTLFQITNNTSLLNVQNARLSLELAKQNYSGSEAILNSIENEINSAMLKCKNDSINYFRQRKLWEQSIGSEVQLETKKLNYELSMNALKLLRSRYGRSKRELETTVQQSENNYQTSLINTKDFTVNSKINGKVYELYKKLGEIINSIEPIAAIGSKDVFIIEMLVDEVDIVRISKSQEVLLYLDAYDGEIFTGYISKIYPKKDERNQTFTVEALFDKAPRTLYPGLSGEANIIVGKKTNVLTIPKDYLIDGNKVKTKEGLITVTKGLENMEHIEVLSGISRHTQLYKPE